MSASTHVDPVAGLAFFRSGPLFVCSLAPPRPGESRLSALMAFAFRSDDGRDRFDEALDFARGGGRDHMIVVERLALITEPWPSSEPPHATRYTIERGGFVVLAPSVEAWVSMPPRVPHHLVQLVAAAPEDDERTAHEALASLGCCGLLGRVRAVLLGDSGAEIDAVVCDEVGLHAGWFAAPPVDAAAAVAEVAEVVAPELPSPAISPPLLDPNDLLNEALAAYLAPWPNGARLESWLRSCAPGTDVSAIRAVLDAAVATATDALWNETPAVSWTDAFETRFLDHVSARHPWLGSVGRSSLLAYSRWLVWHEGLSGLPADPS